MYSRTLTHRQRVIWALAARGFSYGQIADQLGIAHGTVHNHLRIIRTHLGARHTVDLTLAAMGENLLTPSDLAENAELRRRRIIAAGLELE